MTKRARARQRRWYGTRRFAPARQSARIQTPAARDPIVSEFVCKLDFWLWEGDWYHRLAVRNLRFHITWTREKP